MEWLEGWSVLNQPVHVLSGNEKTRWNGQRGSQCSINQFTYSLEMEKQDGIVRGAVSAQSTSSHTNWNEKARWNRQRGSQCSINQFTYFLEMRKQDGMVRGAVSAQSTSSHTSCK